MDIYDLLSGASKTTKILLWMEKALELQEASKLLDKEDVEFLVRLLNMSGGKEVPHAKTT